MSSRHWNLGIIRLFNDALFEEVLRTNQFGNGVSQFFLDGWMDADQGHRVFIDDVLNKTDCGILQGDRGVGKGEEGQDGNRNGKKQNTITFIVHWK